MRASRFGTVGGVSAKVPGSRRRAPETGRRSPSRRQGAGIRHAQGDLAISNKVFVGNLSFDVTREELIEAFSAAGKVVDAKVPTDRETGRPRGFAFVEFEDDEAAEKSISLMNGKDLKGRPLRVNEAENRPPRPAGAGVPAAPSAVGAPAYGRFGDRPGRAPSSAAPPDGRRLRQRLRRRGDARSRTRAAGATSAGASAASTRRGRPDPCTQALALGPAASCGSHPSARTGSSARVPLRYALQWGRPLAACLLLAVAARPFADERALLDRRLETLRRILPDGPYPHRRTRRWSRDAKGARLATYEVEARPPLESGPRGWVRWTSPHRRATRTIDRFFRQVALSHRLIDVESVALTAAPGRHGPR